METEIWYAQLRLLFSLGEEKYAFVRWYAAISPPTRDDILVQHGCIALEWATDAAGQPWYDVVKFENLRARVYIVPDFQRNDRLGMTSGSTLKDPNDATKAYFHLGAF